MIRRFLAAPALLALAGCATAGAYSPRPFPGASRADAPMPAPSGPAVAVAGPAVPAERSALSSAVVSTAMGLLGAPYRLGGADTSGFDCSGFVQYVLRQHGIGMPRTVIEQFGVGAGAPDVEPGDLVFFQTLGSSASHVGIMIDAESFVHAPNSRGVVRVERLDAPYWSFRYLGARRVF